MSVIKNQLFDLDVLDKYIIYECNNKICGDKIVSFCVQMTIKYLATFSIRTHSHTQLIFLYLVICH